MTRIFSGIQPTGVPHLGNYLGAIQSWVSLQEDHDCTFCLVDMHSLTMPCSPATLRHNTLQSAASLIAAGINPERLYNQSAVSSHARLGWIFNCISRLGWLNRMTQFKDKAGENSEGHSAGLYVYPNLMAADILAFKATLIPVGDDQKQHIELTNNISRSFNKRVGVDFFPKVAPLMSRTSSRIMDLQDGTRKMSKSAESDLSRINLTDTPDQIAKKIRKARSGSDMIPETSESLQKSPEAQNLISIQAAATNQDISAVLAQYGGKPYSLLKNALTESLVEIISPIAAESAKLLTDETHLIKNLQIGTENARKISEPVVDQAEKLIGFLKTGN